MAINKIQFEVQVQYSRPRRWRLAGILPIMGRVRIIPRVDDAPLTELIDRFELHAGMQPAGGTYGGIVPAFARSLRIDDHFRGKSVMATGLSTPLLVCECGEWGCWPLLAEITITQDVVIWDRFGHPRGSERDYGAFGPFRFDRGQYDDALRDLSTPTSSDLP